jgi:hypothetical protein
MTQQLNLFGERYGDDEPCFLTIADGRMVYNRVRRSWTKWPALAAAAADMGHTWQPREVGIPSLEWQLHNSRLVGQRWAPGLDDTAGLGSEAASNGENFTGATGSTPPTGWDAVGLAPDYTVAGGNLTIISNGAGNVGMSQDITVTPGTPMVLEVQTLVGTTGWTIDVNGQSLTLPGGERQFAVSIVPEASPVTVTLTTTAQGTLVLDYVRMYEEAELTGAGGGIIIEPPVPPEYVVKGPYQAGETVFFIQKFRPDLGKECMVWLDVDSDPDPDLALTKQQICESEIDDQAKLAIHAQLEADGCGGLPCVAKNGKLKKAYKTGDD